MFKSFRFVFLIGIAFTVLAFRASKDKKAFATSSSLPKLTVFKAPEGAPKNNTFSVYVRYEGGEWIDLYEYDAEVDDGFLQAPVHHMAFVSFDADFSKKIEVRVQKNDGNMSNVKIRPAIAGITPKIIDSNTIIFSLIRPGKLSVEVNGDLHNNLMVFASKPERNTVKKGQGNVHYFGPGIHKIGGDGKGTLTLKSNDKVYIAGGAIVYGNIEVDGVNNISITGRGILCGGMYTNHAYPHVGGGKRLIYIKNSTNIKIEGITLLNSVSWNIHLSLCKDVVCKDLKIIGWTINSDGIDPTSSSNVLIDDCFIRDFDDCISVKLSYAEAANPQARDSRNITVQNCILWTDQGRAIAIGPESFSNEKKVYEDLTFKNIDILYNKNYNVEWAKGVLSILLGDEATIKNVLFKDIRVDRLGDKTNLVYINILKTPYNLSPGQRVQNIKFENVSLNSAQNMDNFIGGLNSSRIVSGIEFINLKINNVPITDSVLGRFKINNHTGDIKFNISN